MKFDSENEIREDENKEQVEGSAAGGSEFSGTEPTETEAVPSAGEGSSSEEGTDEPNGAAAAAAAAVDDADEGAGPAESSPEELAPSGPQARNPDNPNMRWYVVHTYSGYEEKAKTSLIERVKSGGAHEKKFGEVIVPTSVSETTTKTGKKRQVTRTQFPGYMLVQMELDDNTLMLVKDTPRITGFVGNQRSPRPLPDHEVMRYINPEAAAEYEATKPVQEVLFEKGEGVKVIDGPFSNFDGVVDEVKPDKARLRVLVSIFGRETPVELAYNQVEKLN